MRPFVPSKPLMASPEQRDKRSKAELDVILARDPRCFYCSEDLEVLQARSDQLLAAWSRWLLAMTLAGVDTHETWHTFSGNMVAGHPLFDTLRSLGFTHPNGPLAEVDHVLPLWAGGRDELRNLCAACQPCHRRKTKREAGLRARMSAHVERNPQPQPMPDRDELRRLLFAHGSKQKVAKVLGWSAQAVGKACRDYGIRMR